MSHVSAYGTRRPQSLGGQEGQIEGHVVADHWRRADEPRQLARNGRKRGRPVDVPLADSSVPRDETAQGAVRVDVRPEGVQNVFALKLDRADLDDLVRSQGPAPWSPGRAPPTRPPTATAGSPGRETRLVFPKESSVNRRDVLTRGSLVYHKQPSPTLPYAAPAIRRCRQSRAPARRSRPPPS